MKQLNCLTITHKQTFFVSEFKIFSHKILQIGKSIVRPHQRLQVTHVTKAVM